jgi:hypothetical protein
MNSSHIRIYDGNFFKSWERFAEYLQETFDGQMPEDMKGLTIARQLKFSITIGALGQLLEDLKERKLAEEFHFLSTAFWDLAEDGVVSPLFTSQTKRKRGRSKDSSELWQLRAAVVIGIKFMIAGGIEKEEAHKLALKNKKGLSALLRPGTELKSSLKTWAASFEAARVTNELAVEAYCEGMKRLELYKGSFRKEVLCKIGERHIQQIAKRASSRPLKTSK